MKKALKITGITFLVVVLLLLLAPFLFQSQIKEMVKNFINENLNAQVAFTDVDLSLIRSFPQANVKITDLLITNFEPFKGDTLVNITDVSFKISVKELFKNATDAPIAINAISIDGANLTIKTDKYGNNNYDITKEKESTSTENSSSFSVNIDEYSIQNSSFSYLDATSNVQFFVTDLNHSGKGSFSTSISELETKSDANVSLIMDEVKYLSNNHIILEALIDLDLEHDKYTFKENKATINKLPLEFKGFVQLIERGQEIDISFQNPGSSFKDFLAVIPETYEKSVENVQTTGDFKVKGIIKGLVSEKTIPTLDISITSNNASFKYPDLPKSVQNIVIDTSIKNNTGNVDDTFIDIKTLNFKIDEDVFKSSAIIKNITKNMLVKADIDGTLNLANITKAYDFKLDSELSGILKATVKTSFDMNSLETNAYERIKNSGKMSITDFVFASEDFKSPLHISKAAMTFNPSTVTLNNFSATTGKSDLKATGTIQEFLGFLFNKNDLKGNFVVTSNNFTLSDFMTDETAATTKKEPTTKSESFKIPSFLDCTINATATNVQYDNLNLKNVKGILVIKDEQAHLKELTTSIFDGVLALSGNISSKNETPTFDVNLGMEDFDISQSFNGLELFQNIAPIAKALDGKLNTTINLKGTLDDSFIPNLATVSGNAFTKLTRTDLKVGEVAVLNKLKGVLSFVDFEKLDLKELKTKLEFENGKVAVKPFNITYKDIDMVVAGSHSFDKTMAYNIVLNVPAKYLGAEVNKLMNKINDVEVNKITIPITADITGSYNSPKITTDLTSGVTNLTKQLIEIEKQKLINKGKDKIKDLLGEIIDKTNTPNEASKDTIKVETQRETDSIATKKSETKEDPIKEGVKDILGGIFKKKKDTTK